MEQKKNYKKIKVTITMQSAVWNKFRACIILEDNNIRCISDVLNQLMEQYIKDHCDGLNRCNRNNLESH